MKKTLVLGLDCAEPRIVYDILKDDLPNLNKIMRSAKCCKMKSCFPPITIPAWLCMATGKTPGELGLYGFRHRKMYSYTDFWIASSKSVKSRTVWDILGERGYESLIVGFPPTYPPREVKGWLISDFTTPSQDSEFTYPPELKKEVLEISGGKYIFDVPFRKHEKDAVKKEIFEMTEMHFKVLKHLLERKSWDFCWFVEIGLDRIHHAFWKYFDKKHKNYTYSEDYSSVIEDYYKLLDYEIGEIMDVVGDCNLLVVSDHGAKRMDGAFVINQYLEKKGYLSLRNKPEKGASLKDCEIEWEKTLAWAWGGYYARVYLNVEGREMKGVIKPHEYHEYLEKLKKELMNIKLPNGKKMRNLVHTPEEIYDVCEGEPPDLMVVFDDLYWRSAGTMGHETIYLEENDTGPDDAMHDWYGIFILKGKTDMKVKDIIDIYDVKDIILSLYQEV